jgi:glycopeptide antibiotics resistance protein
MLHGAFTYFQIADLFYNTAGGILGGLLYWGTLRRSKRC